MSANTNNYYSGQGSLYQAKRNPTTGAPMGFSRVGNIPELTLDIEVDKFEHKESETGSRLLDLTIIKEKKGKFKFKLENLSPEMLALFLFGSSAVVAGGTVATGSPETIVIPQGAKSVRFPLAHPKVSAVTVKDATNTTNYVLGTDYTLDAKNGVIELPVGGDIVDDASLADTSIKVAYTYAGYVNMEAFTTGNAPERYLRFEGLNTADGSTVVIDLFRCQFDPLTGYSLINDELASADVSGYLLADPSITEEGKSPFFRQRNIAAA